MRATLFGGTRRTKDFPATAGIQPTPLTKITLQWMLPKLLVIYMLALGIGSLFFAKAIWKSVTDYRSAYPYHADLPGGRPLTDRLVLVVLDGIRVDALPEMDFLTALGRRGSSGVVRIGQPSLSNPSRAVIATGAWAEVNGVTNNSDYSAPEVDSIFSLAKRVGLEQAAAGSSFWSKAFGAYLGDRVRTHRKGTKIGDGPSELIEWQQKTCASDIEFLSGQTQGLVVLGLTAADSAGHDFGGKSLEYLETVKAVDDCLRQAVEAFDDSQTTFVITSDHGHIQRRGGGGHGGGEDEVVDVPLVLFGEGVREHSGWEGAQADIAPTICALLGLPLPATNQGGILWDSLDLAEDDETELRGRELEQRELALAKLPNREQGVKAERRERSLRAIGLFTLFSVVLIWTGVRRPRSALWLASAVIVYYGLYYLLFWAFGLGYSLSAVGRQEYLLRFFARDLGATAIALAGASWYLASRLTNWRAVLLLDLAVLVSATVALQVTAIYFWHGLIMGGFMLELGPAFKACIDLMQLFALGMVAPVIYWVALGRERRRERQREASA
jgi:hypothetical protein